MKISLVDITLGGNFKETCVIANTTYDLEIATFNLRSQPSLLTIIIIKNFCLAALRYSSEKKYA